MKDVAHACASPPVIQVARLKTHSVGWLAVSWQFCSRSHDFYSLQGLIPFDSRIFLG